MRTVLVSTSAELAAASKALEGAPRIFLDTEFLSGPGIRRLALAQVSRGGGEVFLVDTMKLAALEPLAAAIGRPGIEWVAHAGRQDVELLLEALRLPAAPALFDTQTAWGLLGPEYPVSLAYLLFKILGLRAMKSEQAVDWTRRPLSPEQIDYAADDVAHLPDLHAALEERLAAKGRGAIARAASADAAGGAEPPRTLSLADYRNAWQLDGPGLAVLRHLIDAHNALPGPDRELSLPPQAFLAVAKLIPETAEEFSRIRGIPFAWVKRHGQAAANAIVRVSARAARERFEPLDPPPYATWPEILAEGRTRDWAARAAAAVGAAPELLFPGRLQRDMAAKAAAGAHPIEALSGWRRELLGADPVPWA
jgi:ribonuclease D